MTRSFTRSRLGACASLVAAMTFLGCGKSTPQGEISGKITFNGKPVAEGTVSFMNDSAGTGTEGPLKDGNYKLNAPLAPGEYKVMVTPLVVLQQDGGKGPEVAIEKPAPDIPKKYRVIGTTDLKATVKDGKQEINFELKP